MHENRDKCILLLHRNCHHHEFLKMICTLCAFAALRTALSHKRTISQIHNERRSQSMCMLIDERIHRLHTHTHLLQRGDISTKDFILVTDIIRLSPLEGRMLSFTQSLFSKITRFGHLKFGCLMFHNLSQCQKASVLLKRWQAKAVP